VEARLQSDPHLELLHRLIGEQQSHQCVLQNETMKKIELELKLKQKARQLEEAEK
jgi:hypothetical protein